jgi:hypothetical protein
MGLLIPETSVEQLARETPPEVSLTPGERMRIAHLAYALSQESNRRAGSLETLTPFDAMPAEKKQAASLGVLRVIQAMHLLGYVTHD